MSEVALVAAAATDRGPIREQNEDAHLVDADASIFLVADGIGGKPVGEVASATAIEHVHSSWLADTVTEARRLLACDGRARAAVMRAVRAGVLAAHQAILDAAQQEPTRWGMGTTLTGMVVTGGSAIFAHVGDSRAYVLRGARLLQLSEDHSATSADGSVSRLTNALGLRDIARVNLFSYPLCAGDRLLLCSDGVHGPLTDDQLMAAMSKNSTTSDRARSLVREALAAGGHDNATAVVVDVLSGGHDVAQCVRDADAVAECPLFESLSVQERLRVARVAYPAGFDSQSTLGRSSEQGPVAYVVLEGDIAGPSGRSVPTGTLLYPEGLIAGAGSRRGSARAVGPSRCLVIARDDFLDLCEEEPDLGVKLYAVLARLMAARALGST